MPVIGEEVHWPPGAFGTEAMPMTSGVLLPHTSGYDERDVMLLLSAEFQITARQNQRMPPKEIFKGASQGTDGSRFKPTKPLD